MFSGSTMVVVSRDIPELGLACGDVGSIISILDYGRSVLVEFINAQALPVKTYTLSINDLKDTTHMAVLNERVFTEEAN